MAKGRILGRGRQVDCIFRCPVRGYVDFPVWPRRGESPRQACFRRLSTLVDEAQLPLCEEIRVRTIDGLGKATTRFSKPIRLRDLGRYPRVKIVRED